MKKTRVFHSGRVPDGKRTNWVMHEYRLCYPELEIAGISQDAFVLCKIFQKSCLGPPNGDWCAPLLEEEWDDEAVIVIPGGAADDAAANGDEAPGAFIDLDQNTQPENPVEASLVPYKRDSSEDPNPLSVAQSKRLRLADPNCSRAIGSEDSTTGQGPPSLMMMKDILGPLLEFPLLEPLEPDEYPPADPLTFDSSTLEKSVPPGYLKFIGNLENEIFNVSMEKETLKIELIRAQAMINVLQSRIDILSKENDELEKRS